MKHHPCRNCMTMPQGANYDDEPCKSCNLPREFSDAIDKTDTWTEDMKDRKVKDVVIEPVKATIKSTDIQPAPKNDADPGLYKCKECGNEFPRTSEYFNGHHRIKDGLQRICKSCFGKKISIGAKKTWDKKREALKDSKAPMSPKKVNYESVWIDFSGHIDILESVKKLADEEIRSFGNQVLVMLREQLRSKGEM